MDQDLKPLNPPGPLKPRLGFVEAGKTFIRSNKVAGTKKPTEIIKRKIKDY